MPDTLTVVVPALNEAERLPLLFDALERQTRRPDQIVVADAGSTDDTREVASARGAVGCGRWQARRRAQRWRTVGDRRPDPLFGR